jgi:hypothetical protein
VRARHDPKVHRIQMAQGHEHGRRGTGFPFEVAVEAPRYGVVREQHIAGPDAGVHEGCEFGAGCGVVGDDVDVAVHGGISLPFCGRFGAAVVAVLAVMASPAGRGVRMARWAGGPNVANASVTASRGRQCGGRQAGEMRMIHG